MEEDSKHRELNSSISGKKRNLEMGKGKEEGRKEGRHRARYWRMQESTQEGGCQENFHGRVARGLLRI